VTSGAGRIERFATGDWLTANLIAFTGIMTLIGTVAALVLLVVTANGTVDAYGRPLGTDFSAFWTAGCMALEGRAAEAYDWPAHLEMQHRTHGVELFYPWSYPPVFLLLAAALATLPYLASLLLWQATTLAASLATLNAILPGRRALLLGLAFPAVLVCLGHGQTGFLTGALLAGGLLILPRHEIVAGVLFGLLIYKPHFGLLLPFVLAATGRWRTIVAAAAAALAIVGLTFLIWGAPVWQAFVDSIPLTRAIVLEPDQTRFDRFQSAFAWMRLWGAPVSVAYMVQALVAGTALITCIWIWRSRVDHRLKAAAVLAGSLLASPYVLDYDFVVLGMAIAFVVAEAIESGFARWEKTVLACAWLAPLVAREMARLLYLPVGLSAAAAVLLLVVIRVRREHAEAIVAPTFAAAKQL